MLFQERQVERGELHPGDQHHQSDQDRPGLQDDQTPPRPPDTGGDHEGFSGGVKALAVQFYSHLHHIRHPHLLR